MKEYKGYIFDMDGVIYTGKKLIPGAIEALEFLKNREKKIVFVSNNSTRSREDYAERIADMGLPIKLEEIIPATYATAQYLAENHSEKRIFVIGSLGLIKELLKVDLRIEETAEKADILVTGSDLNISYQKLSYGTSLLLRDALWVTTNTDKLYPSESGMIPGTGAVVGALQYVTGRTPDVIIGKPSKPIMEQALKALGLDKNDCLMVGDIIESDVLAGRNIGMDTALVLTGVTSLKDVEKTNTKPDYILESIKDLVS
jgi:4-nitrophenyl phosphatase